MAQRSQAGCGGMIVIIITIRIRMIIIIIRVIIRIIMRIKRIVAEIPKVLTCQAEHVMHVRITSHKSIHARLCAVPPIIPDRGDHVTVHYPIRPDIFLWERSRSRFADLLVC